MVTPESRCPACGHDVWEHYGRWCRVPTGAVNAEGRALICTCAAVDRDDPGSTDEGADHDD